ncbi:MAG: glutamate synthase [candidate division KSB1 bacterium]|nr:glutamate synthase [candidate division KSB1 bacterium]
MDTKYAERILASRRDLMALTPPSGRSEEAAEGGCGVLGLIATAPIAGRHVLTASLQMHNRGNGKGGGIATVGLDPAQVRVDAETLRTHYLLQIALLDPSAREEVERDFILPHFDIAQAYELPHVEDFRQVQGLEVRPPDVWRYFVRVRPEVLARFAKEKGLEGFAQRMVEDEFVYQNSYRLNVQFYASLGEKRAFVLSHGRNLSVLKIVGYAEQVVKYYRLEDQTAHVWIAHQRYPTKGRVWHPGGAHPFVGLNEALVHNGDFANYHAVTEYLRQRNIGQLFLTDTEVSVQLFDLWDRVYGYPLEVTLEAMAPTTEYDFLMLPPKKRELYRAVQRTHLHGSPDGPWFFIVARSKEDTFELLGITDTSMLRPQVFALYENIPRSQHARAQQEGVQVGLIASERQAINACLRSLAEEDERFKPLADKYWVARGGSHTDGGAFRFVLTPVPSLDGQRWSLRCTNKFGQPVRLPCGGHHAPARLEPERAGREWRSGWEQAIQRAFDNGGAPTAWNWISPRMKTLTWNELAWSLNWLVSFGGQGFDQWYFAREMLTLLRDRRTDLGDKKRASLLTLVDESLIRLFEQAQHNDPSSMVHRVTWDTRHSLSPAPSSRAILVLDALGFPPEGEESAARWMVRAYEQGWRHLIIYRWRGGRFAACGLGPGTHGTRIDLYGDVGDYAGSGLDGAEVYLHGDGQDQLGQILKDGRLVIYGDVGQTFLYGAKGGEVYVLGSAAGRPLINAVGKPRVVINGTCLDYLAESFMAGDPHQGGGFVILNGVAFSEDGNLEELPSPYPGGNLFSLASGGAIFLRDPHHLVSEEQLNGGTFVPLTEADWALMEPYLRENERLFGIRLENLLNVEGRPRAPQEVYRKVIVQEQNLALREEESC